MKKILILILGISLISCNQETKNQEKEPAATIEKTENFDWLLGDWKRLNETEGKETYEKWERINENEYVGIGFTMQYGDTIQQEKMNLLRLDQKWNLSVKMPDATEATTFIGTSHNTDEFTCENNKIDFPNKIKYWRNGEKLNASVSNSEMEITFEFEKIKY
jgi:hypothetical protein